MLKNPMLTTVALFLRIREVEEKIDGVAPGLPGSGDKPHLRPLANNRAFNHSEERLMLKLCLDELLHPER